MTAIAPPVDQTPSISYFSQDRTVAAEEDVDGGGLLVRGLKVFRTGTFRDSKGRKLSWSTEDLDKMVSNFALLRSQGLFVDVPVRVDHGISAKDVVGYFAGLYRAGDFLLCDLEFTEPEAALKWKRKTFRARSLEVGPYISNDDQIFYPCANGLAFVDIGAVEHLHRVPEIKETTPVTEKPAQEATFRISGVPTTDVAAVQARIDELETAAKNPPAPHAFRIAGEEVTDYPAVQAKLDTYGEMFDQMRENTRSEFVNGLARDNKIAATGLDDEIAFVKSLDEAQFAAYRKRWEGAPATSLFSRQPGGAGDRPPAPPTNAPTQVDTDKAVVAQFRRGGLGDEAIKNMPSYKRLVAAGQTPF